MTKSILGFFLAVCLAAIGTVNAATNSWTGSGGDGLWNNPANWSLSAVPATTDDVRIDLAGTYTVELNADATVTSLVIGATQIGDDQDTNSYPALGMQTLRMAQTKTLTCSGQTTVTPAGLVSFESGTLAAEHLLVNGQMNWSGGTLYGGNMFTSWARISPVGQMRIHGVGPKSIDSQWMTNYGAVTCQAEDFSIFPGTFHNMGTFSLETNFHVSGGGGDFYNSGTVVCPADLGELTLQVSANFWTAGSIVAETNTTLKMLGTLYRFWPGASFGGEGVVRFSGEAEGFGALSVNGTFHLKSAGIGGSYTWQGNGSFIWESGSLYDGNNTFAEDLQLTFTSSADKTFANTITNLGTMLWQADGAQLNGQAFWNSGTFQVESNCSISVETFCNTGSIVRPADAGEAFLFNMPVFFWEGNFYNRGTISADANSTLILSGEGYLFEDGTQINGEGVVRVSGTVGGDGDVAIGGNLELHFGQIGGNHTWIGPGRFEWRSGSFDDSGTSVFASDAQLLFTGSEQKNLFFHTITNLGTVMWQADGGSLYSEGEFWNAGTFVIENNCSLFGDGNFYNTGTITRGEWLWDAFLFNNQNFYNRGILSADGHSSISLSGEKYFFENGSQISGDGEIVISGLVAGDGEVTVNGTLQLSYGTIGGNHLWTGNGHIRWMSGGFDNGGTSIFAEGTHLDFIDSTQKLLNFHSITNFGTATWQADGGYLSGTGGTFCNAGTFIVETNCSLQSAGDFINEGTILRPDNSGECFLFNSANFFNRGSISAGTNSVLNLSGSGYQFEFGSQIQGDGLVRFSGLGAGSGSVKVSGTFELYYGTISGDHIWFGTGCFNWRSGGFDNYGTSLFAENFDLNIIGTEQKSLNNYTLNNDGVITWLADGGYLQGMNAAFNNDGIFVVQTNCSLQGSFNFFNTGTIIRPANSGEAFFFNGANFFSRGTIQADNNSVLNVSGSGYMIEDGTVFAGDGLVRLSAISSGAGNISLTGTLELFYGTIGGNHVWSGSGNFDWRSGGFDNFGGSTFAEDTHLNFVGADQKSLNFYSITNLGTATWQADGGYLTGTSGAFINDGNFVVATNCSLQGGCDFINQGTVVRPENSGEAFLFSSQNFFNRGTIAAETNSVLNVSGSGYTLEDGTEFSGEGMVRWSAISGGDGDITVSGLFDLFYGTINGTHTWSGPGRFDWRSGGFDNGGSSTFAQGMHLHFVSYEAKYLGIYTITNLGTATWEADGGYVDGDGVWYNEGTFIVATNCSFAGGGVFVNSGTIRQLDGFTTINRPLVQDGTIELVKGTFIPVYPQDITATSVQRFALAGYNESSDFGFWSADQLIRNGQLSVTLTNGFVPTNGASFRLFQGISQSGEFSLLDLPTLPSNMQWQVSYPTSGVLLTVEQAPVITAQPVSKSVQQGTNVTFTVGVEGSDPLSYQWHFEGQPVSGGTSSTFAISNVQGTNAGNYFVVVSNSVGTATSDIAALEVITDSVRPTVTILSPKMNFETNGAAITLTGNAKDTKGVVDVKVALNGGTGVSAIRTGPATNVNWSLPLQLAPGTNTVVVTAYDLAGNFTNATRKFFRIVMSTLTVNVAGNGWTVPTTNTFGATTNNALLQVGRSYRIKAVAGPNFIFTNWTGSISSPTNVLNFIMQQDMILTANFITNPFIAVSGSYNGLFFEDTGVEHHSAGFFNMTVSPNLFYSAKLLLEGDTLTFSGNFSLPGTVARTISRARLGKPDLSLTFELDFTNQSDQVTGTLQCSNLWAATLIGDRAIKDTNYTMPFAAKYTLLVPGLADPLVGPPGFTTGSATVGTNGKVSFTGRMADGTSAGHGVPISKNGLWPFFVRSYTDRVSQTNTITSAVRTNILVYRGAMMGWLALTNVAWSTNKAPVGDLSWIKTTMAPTNRFYPNGFTNDVPVTGSIFVPPPKNTRLFGFTNGTISFAHGNLASPFTNNVFFRTNNILQITGVNTNATKPTVSALSGLIEGTFLHPDNANALTKIYGVILQEQGYGVGQFLGTNKAGTLLLLPQ